MKDNMNNSIKQCLIAALDDTLEVVMWSGVPAIGMAGLLESVAQDIPAFARYLPFVQAAINIVAYFAKRFLDYYRGDLEL